MCNKARIIKLEAISKSYDGKTNVIDNLNLEIYAGDIVVIEGKSGSGKSTLLNILGMLHNFDQGTYRFKNTLISNKNNRKKAYFRSEKVGFIFQSYHLMENLTVMDNILLPYLYGNKKLDNIVINRALKYMEQFNLSGMENKKVSLLSGGEKQRVAMVRAIIKEPKVVIADEPTGSVKKVKHYPKKY
ncbi:MAG: ABC transporter ATP-binding protein [Lachnospiraceae bacterium]|nr:ABC transporter ATP-binding protein [Lachnospiraceae bacterium]